MSKRGCKYDPLQRFLQFKDSNRMVMTFSEVEVVLGFTLPISAYKYAA